MAMGIDQRVLVTGGAGLIGSALVWELNRQGVENVVVCDKLGCDEKWRNLVPLRYADYLDGDELLAQIERSDEALGRFDAVYHLGACSATTERDAGYLMRNNFQFTQRLAAWCLRRDTRFVYASSAATYGDGEHGMSDELADLGRLRPLNAYGYSKHWFDQYAQRQGWLGSIVGLKYFNVFGPNEDHKAEMRSVVNKAYGQIMREGRVQLFSSANPQYGDGEMQRDFLYVKDAVRMTLHLGQSAQAAGLYNLGSGKARSWLDLARAIFAALGREPAIEFIPMPEALRAKYQYFTCAQINRLRSSGYEAPITELEEAVRDYVQGYLMADRRLGDEASSAG
jgi:ADP-L-glycero-D-manno-heptose 6-epimerase